MRPIGLPETNPIIVRQMAQNIEMFLRAERLQRNNQWFTGEQIAALMGLPQGLMMAFTYAYNRLNFDVLEIDEDTAAIRYRG